jgi:hypothetical protein
MKNDLQRLIPEKAKWSNLERIFRLFEKDSSRFDGILSRLVRRIPRMREYFTFQYLFVIEK